jgi:4'-phosphopantetheinyl transferase
MKISSGEVHLWYAFEEQIAARYLYMYRKLLNKTEQEQYERYVMEKHRHRYLITRILIRTLLSRYRKEVVPEEWEFSKDKYGKPFISHPPLSKPIFFNISHSEKMIVLAVACNPHIGVDVEYLSRSINTMEVAMYSFADIEVDRFIRLSPLRQKDYFFQLWTLKEAFIKAVGMGLALPLSSFSFSILRTGEINVVFDKDIDENPAEWQFWQIILRAEHRIALALKTGKNNRTYSILINEISPYGELSVVLAPSDDTFPIYY